MLWEYSKLIYKLKSNIISNEALISQYFEIKHPKIFDSVNPFVAYSVLQKIK